MRSPNKRPHTDQGFFKETEISVMWTAMHCRMPFSCRTSTCCPVLQKLQADTDVGKQFARLLWENHRTKTT